MKNQVVKIIKKADRERPQELPADSNNTKVKKREATRDTIATITGWVRDVQGRRRGDARRAFDSLFRDPLPGASKS
jgi:hypothetical protein